MRPLAVSVLLALCGCQLLASSEGKASGAAGGDGGVAGGSGDTGGIGGAGASGGGGAGASGGEGAGASGGGGAGASGWRVVWAHGYGARETDGCKAIVDDSLENIYWAGEFSNQLTFAVAHTADSLDGVLAMHQNLAAPPSRDLSLGGLGVDSFDSLAVSETGSRRVIAGFSYDQAVTMPDNATLSPIGSYDAAVTSFDEQLRFQWATTFRSSGLDEVRAVAAGSGGEVYALGRFEGSLQVSGVASIDSPGLGDSDGFLAKLTASGSAAWLVRLGGTSSDLMHAVAVDPSGAVWVTGQLMASSVTIADDTNVTEAGTGVIAKISAGGQKLWSKRFGTRNGAGTAGRDIRLGQDDEVLVAGAFDDDIELGSQRLPHEAMDGFYASIRPSDQQVRWVRAVTGPGRQYLTGISRLDANFLVVAGCFDQPFTFGATTLMPVGGIDCFVGRVRADNGDPVDAFQIGTAGDDDRSDGGLHISGHGGRVAVCGAYAGALRLGGEDLRWDGDATPGRTEPNILVLLLQPGG